MSFRGYVCWNAEQVRTVLDTEAEIMSPAAFRATHQSLDMLKKLVFPQDSGEAYSEEAFLTDFMRPGEDWVFIPVLGWAGTGKSHLVRWLSTRIESTERRKVLLLPKTDTNLKDIIERILNLVDDSSLEEYRKRLNEATENLSPEQARERLLDFVAANTGPNFHPPEEVLTREQRYLISKLPAFLREDLVRNHLLKDGGFFDKLVTHVLGRSRSIERLDARRELQVEDLPLELVNIGNTSAGVQQFYGVLIGQPRMCTEAVSWINVNLDSAINELIRFRGDDLRQLMRGVREHLAVRQVELILLIEDFAKFQGIDLQLLEALLERPLQPGRRPMCGLRTAIAMNAGYFLTLPETLRQRVSFHVDMDVAQDVADDSARALIVQFAAGYLNAVRFDASELDRWHQSSHEDGSPPPSACSERDCPYLEECHRAFGAVNGYSLYPFNEVALQQLLSRVTNRNQFVPRFLIKDVLKKIFTDYTGEFTSGVFPSRSLLAAYGGSRLDPRIQVELANRDRKYFDRREVLLQIYAEDVNQNGIQDFDPALHEALQIPELGGQPVSPPHPREVKRPSEDKRVKDQPPAARTDREASPPPPIDPLAEAYQQLTDWSNRQKDLPQGLLSKLRSLVYGAVDEALLWDAEVLVRSALSSRTGPFRPPSVNLQGQAVLKGNAPVLLELPLPGDTRAETALAMMALLRFEQHRSWAYQGGFDDLRILGRHCTRWTEAVRTQLHSPSTSKASEFDVVPAIVEVMALGGQLHRQHRNLQTSLAEQLDELLSPPLATIGRCAKWTSVAEAYRSCYQELRNILLSRTACVKGGSDRTMTIVDASRILPHLKRVRSRPEVASPIPDDLWLEYAKLKEARRHLERSLADAVRSENAAWQQWDRDIGAEFSADDVARTVNAIRDFIKFVVDRGQAVHGLREDTERALELVVADEMNRLLRTLTTLKSSDSVTRWNIITLNYPPVMQSARTLVETARKLVDAVDKRISTELDMFGSGEGNLLENELTQMRTACDKIIADANTLIGGGSRRTQNGD